MKILPVETHFFLSPLKGRSHFSYSLNPRLCPGKDEPITISKIFFEQVLIYYVNYGDYRCAVKTNPMSVHVIVNHHLQEIAIATCKNSSCKILFHLAMQFQSRIFFNVSANQKQKSVSIWSMCFREKMKM